MRRRQAMRFLMAAVLCTLPCVSAFGSLINETALGAGNTPGTAQAIPDSAFTLPLPATVFPGLGPTATVTGGLQTGSDIDFYSFNVLTAMPYVFDIDNNPFTFDTILSLFNSSGTLLAYDDDSFPADPGTQNSLDSYLGAISLQPGLHYIAISRFANFPTQSNSPGTIILTRPDGAFGGRATPNALPGVSTFGSSTVETSAGGQGYTLHISQVPEPSTWSLFAVGGMLLTMRKKLRRQRGQ